MGDSGMPAPGEADEAMPREQDPQGRAFGTSAMGTPAGTPADPGKGLFTASGEATPEQLEALRDQVARHAGVRTCGLRPDMVSDVVGKRMDQLGMTTFEEYAAFVRTTPTERAVLSGKILISASHFFRDPYVFEVLDRLVVPSLLAGVPRGPILVWSAGCARGEEAYSVAILFAEAQKRMPDPPEVFVLGSDVDRKALEWARIGHYPPEALVEVKKGLLDEYFEPFGSGYAIRPMPGVRIQFAEHDLTSCERPRIGLFSDYHLILCRNVLMYFAEDVRRNTLSLFDRSLVAGGCLVLGQSETLRPEFPYDYEETARGANVLIKGG